MKYRVTTRGWIVFPIVGILSVILLLFILSSLFDGNETDNIDNDSDIITSNSTEDTIEGKSEVELETSDTVDETSDAVDETSDGVEETSDGVVENSSEDSSDEENDTTENTTDNVISEQTIDMNKTTNILFDKNVFELKNISIDAIEEWLTILNDNKELQIVIEGHINGYPYYEDGKFGLALAESRAQVISDYFINQGISKDRITIINMGSKTQVDESKELDKHYLNRRSVIYINKKP